MEVQDINNVVGEVGETVTMLNQRVDELESNALSETSEIYDTDSQEIVSTEYESQPLEKVDREKVLASQFQAELIDSDWSEAAQTKLDSLFYKQDTEYFGNVDVAGIECRSTSCKIDLQLQGSIDVEDFEFNFFVDASAEGFPRVSSTINETTGLRSYYLSDQSQSGASTMLDNMDIETLLNNF